MAKRKFSYKPRTAEQVKRRAEQKTGGYDSYINDDITLFKTKGDTDYVIRLLPPTWDGADHYGIDIYVHYGIGADNNSYLCPLHMKNERCPICDEREKADQRGDEEQARELAATKRVMVWLVDRDNEADGPVVWAMPVTLDKEINRRAIDKHSGEVLPIDSPDEGYDVEFTREGTGWKTKYVGVDIARKSSPLAEDEDDEDDWLDFVSDNALPDVLIFHDYDYISRMFGGGTTPEKEEEKEEEEERPSRRSRTRKEEPEDDTDEEEIEEEGEEEEEEEKEERPRRRSRRDKKEDVKEDSDDDEEEEEESGRERLRRLRGRRGRK